MTSVSLYSKNGTPVGFCITGHSTENAEDMAGKIVCSAVSSAAYMAANTILEVIKDKCFAGVDDAKMTIKIENPSEKSIAVLEGFSLHIIELAKQYPKNLKIISEV